MITLFRRDPDQGWSYREAWHDAEAAEFVIHHGKVGTHGTVTSEPAEEQQAQALLDGFTAQCEADGFSVPAEDELRVVQVLFPLRGAYPSASERRNAGEVHRAVLVNLAWKGLGALSDPESAPDGEGGTALVMTAETVHRGKAREAVLAAVRSTDVPPSKVRVRVRRPCG